MRRLAALLCTLVLCAGCSEPPQKEIDRAQGAIDAARAAGAERYASAELTEATNALRESHEAVDQRDYRLALSRALDASQRAQEAARQAAEGKARARSDAESAIQTAIVALQQLDTKLKAAAAAKIPEQDLKHARQTSEAATGTLQKARALLRSGDYLEARGLVKDTASTITEEIRRLDEDVKGRPARRRR